VRPTPGSFGSAKAAGVAVGQLRRLAPDFNRRDRQLIRRYLKVDDLVEKIIEGLQTAGGG
jgi:hypothetical protein